MNDAYPYAGFDDHIRTLKWKQGEHVFIAGSTGSGKTTIARTLVERRSHVITFAVKPYDSTLKNDFADWDVVGSWKEIEPHMNRIILWPKPKKNWTAAQFKAHQRNVFNDAFDRLLRARNWCVLIDEGKYMSDPKFGGVGDQIEMLHYIGRASGTSVVTLAQRPAHIPLAVLSSASHAYIAKTRLGTDAKRLSELGGIDPRELQNVLASLPNRHEFVYTPTQGDGTPAIVNTARRTMKGG